MIDFRIIDIKMIDICIIDIRPIGFLSIVANREYLLSNIFKIMKYFYCVTQTWFTSRMTNKIEIDVRLRKLCSTVLIHNILNRN